jgi:hypothetical protein
MSTQRFHYPFFVATTRNKRPILSGRISAFQRFKWPYLDNRSSGHEWNSCPEFLQPHNVVATTGLVGCAEAH